VSHAGSGTVLGALAAHLPQVCLPLGADQFTNAEQVARCGAGIAIPTDGRDVEAIRRAVEAVLSNDSYASRATAMQAEIDTMTPAAEVLTTIERRAADRISSR
jgi:UDP:flavonoid glycosyltransferase YjiC (YdhE family)